MSTSQSQQISNSPSVEVRSHEEVIEQHKRGDFGFAAVEHQRFRASFQTYTIPDTSQESAASKSEAFCR